MPHTLHVLRTLLACSTPVQLGEPPVDSLPPPVDSTAEAGPRLFINELMAESEGSYVNADGQPVDWFELYNPEDAAVDLEGWWISDDTEDKFKWQIPPGVSIDAKGYLVFFADGDTGDGPLHASFQLGGLKNEDVALYGPNVEDNPLVDAIEDMGISVPDISIARMPDGGPTWEQDASPTPGEANQ
ncbi:MAG: lamin tail domain-containing protein [Myxococcales bacterium]|nr:lamin tail domain-containing protein [Myxococcales bacterium]